MKRSELQLVLAVVAYGLLGVIALMARRYSTAAALTTNLKVELHASNVVSTGQWVVDGVHHPFTVSGPTNFTAHGRRLVLQVKKVSGTNDVDVSMFVGGRLVRRHNSPGFIECAAVCPDPFSSGLRFWETDPKTMESFYSKH